MIITDTEVVNRISGGSGNDVFQGGSEDLLDYSLEDAYPEEHKNGSGINANLSTGEITDTYGDVDQINNLEMKNM